MLAIAGALTTVVIKIGDLLVEPIKRQYSYLFRYKRNIKKLENEAKTLENMRLTVQLLVDQATNNSKIIGPDVEEWLSRVDDIQKEPELDLLTADNVENRRWLAYSLSKKAVKKIKVIVELQAKGRFDRVSYDPPAPRVTASTRLNSSEGFESRLSIMKDVMEALKEENIQLIGICGMGGVGKTTMVNDIAAKVIDDNLFDVVAKAVVTQSPDLKSIQGSIADFLGLKFGEEGLLARAALLRDTLLKGSRRVLVILDNIWTTLDLEELGIPPVDRCTIMLTSRNADVCEEMGVDKFFKIEPMPHKEAWVLFQNTADKLFHTHAWRYKFQGIAQEIVKECEGWPLAIVTIAGALRSKRQKFMWDNALQSLRNSNFESDYKAMYSALQVSFEFLESDELKHLFLLCCLFPHGYDILAEDLLRFGSGLRLFTYMDVFDMTRTRTKACIQKLKNLSLLLDNKDEECVRMHDVVHTFVMTVASKQEHLLVRHNEVSFRPRGDVEKISLWCEEMQGLLAGLEFTKLKLLLLVGSSDLLQFPQNFCEGMGQLKVLIQRGMLIKSLPRSFERLSILQTLSLDYCTFGKDCDLSIIGNLVNLEILSFVHSDVKTIPMEVRNLVRLRLFDMTGCKELLNITSGVLQSLINLEELYLRGSLLNWPGEQTKACLRELTSLSRLAALEIELPSLQCLPEEMVYEKLTRFRICIGFAIESQAFQNTLKILFRNHSWNWREAGWLFQRAEILCIHSNFSKQRTNYNAMLESSYLNRMPFSDSWMCHAQQQPFLNLRVLDIFACRDLKYVFSLSTARAFVNLESVKIHGCLELEEIFRIEDEKVGVKIELPKLKSLRLEYLPYLTCFCKKAEAVVIPELVVLELDGLVIPNFTYTWLTSFGTESKHLASSNHLFSKQKIALGRKTEVFKTTKKLTAVESDLPPSTLYNAKSALSSYSIQSLQCLEGLEIASCQLVEVVFDLEALITEGGNKVEVLNNLRVLTLFNLESMTRVWQHGFNTFESFQNLTTLSLLSCCKINYLFSTVIANSLLQLQELVIKNCINMEEVVKEENGMEMAEKAQIKIIFPRLTSIQLFALRSLRFFCSGSHVEFELPLLKSLMMTYCEKMLTFTAGNSSTPSLQEIGINSCKYGIRGDINSTLQWLQPKSMPVQQVDKSMIASSSGSH